MGLSAVPELWFLVATLPLIIYIAWGDMRSMRIPNMAVLSLVGIFVVLGIFLLPLGNFGWRLAIAAMVLVVTFLLNAARMMGGGDAKLIAAIAPYIDPSDWGVMVYIVPAVILGAFTTHRLVKRTPLRQMTADWASWTTGRRFPMGLALVGMLLLYLAIKVWVYFAL